MTRSTHISRNHTHTSVYHMTNNINTFELDQPSTSTKRIYLYMPRFHKYISYHELVKPKFTTISNKSQTHNHLITLGFDQTNTHIPRKSFLRQYKGLAHTSHQTLMSQGFNVETQQTQHYQNFKGLGYQTLSFNPNKLGFLDNTKIPTMTSSNFKQHFTISLSSLGVQTFSLAYPSVRVFQNLSRVLQNQFRI